MKKDRKIRILAAREKLAAQLAIPDNTTRLLSITLQTSDGCSFSTSISYPGAMTAQILESAETAFEELDWKALAARNALQVLGVENSVPQPSAEEDRPPPF